MRVQTEGKYVEQRFIAKLSTKKDDLRVKSKRDERGIDFAQEAPDGSGRKMYQTSLYCILPETDDSPEREERLVRVSVINAIDFKRGVEYKLEGQVWFVHWQNDSRQIEVSITAESVVPVNAVVAQPAMPEKPKG